MKKYFVLCCAIFLFVSCQSQRYLVLHPDPDKVVITPNDNILVEFIPKSEEQENIDEITFDFGDGSDEVKKQCNEKTILVNHRYPDPDKGDGNGKKYDYESYVELDGVRVDKKKANKEDKKLYYKISVKQNDSQIFEKKIIVHNAPIEDDELQYLAIKEIAEEIEKGIQKVIPQGKVSSISFSSFKDANFESSSDQRDMWIVQKIIQALRQIHEESKKEKNYTILERAPQALVRLAHESVWTLNPKNPSGDLEKADHLEYGLRTSYKGPEQPFLYSVELSGIDDIRIASISSDVIDSFLRDGKEQDDLEKVSTLFKELGNMQKEARTKRPLFFAKFETADFLLVIDRLEYEPVERTKPVYYNPSYDSMVMKRTAKIKVNARILDKKGAIKWIKDIRGVASDKILPQFAPKVGQWSQDDGRYVKSKSPSLFHKYLINPVKGVFNKIGDLFKIIIG